MTTALAPKRGGARPRRGIAFLAPLTGIGISGQVAFWCLVAIALLAVLGPLFVQADPNAVDLDYAYAPMSPWFPLGADASGRDILTRLIVGSAPRCWGRCWW